MRKNGIYKIIDLGFSKKIDNVEKAQFHTIVGTGYTMAP
jgi:serine/threonine protein kinase